MKKLSYLACSVLLASSGAAFAQGFYFQGGGGVGFVNGAIDQAGYSSDPASATTFTPIVDDKTAVSGGWIFGVGYMFNNAFGLEANYLGYSNTSDTKNQSQNFGAGATNVKYKLSTDVYQLNLMGVARTPFEVGLGFFVKAKAGLGYTSQEQTITASEGSGAVTFLKHKQDDNQFSPVLSIGLENDVTDLISLSIEYIAAVNNDVQNSMVYASIKFNPFDVMNSMSY